MVHVFENLGYYFALDVGSGSVHLLDEPAFLLLKYFSQEDLQQGGEIPLDTATLPKEAREKLDALGQRELGCTREEMAGLIQQGLLYSSDDYSEFASSLGPAPVKAICLHVAHDCNLRCRYCFAQTGDFGGPRELMPYETAQKAIDLLVSLSGTRRNLEVDFFGGEPLLNYDVVEKTIAYARSIEIRNNKNFRFTITTNGLALNEERIDSINREMGNVVLSLDGRREVNDRMRPTPSGGGSYEAIVPKFQKLVKQRGSEEYYLRGTYTRDNLDFDKDVLHLSELGFEQISVEPVVGPESDDYSIRKKDLPAIAESYQRLLKAMVQADRAPEGRQFNFFHFMMDLENGPCAIKRLKGCGSGNEYLAVTPEGDLYPCHQFVDNPAFLLGTVETGITNTRLRGQFANANLLNKPACQNCWAKFYCSGGCNANNHNYAGDILRPHDLSCELEKMRLECAITLQALRVLGKSDT